MFLELLFPHLSWKSKTQTYSVTRHFPRSLFLSLPDLAKFPIRLVGGASASPCRFFPPPGLLHHTRCWSPASALSHPCTFLFNRVLDHSAHCFFSFHCDAVLGTDFQIRGAFFSCHISEVGTKNPVSPSAGTPDLLTTFKLRWAASDLELPGPLSS